MKRKNNLLTKVLVAVCIGVLMLFITSAYTDRAEVRYSISGQSYALPLEEVSIDFKLANYGKVGMAPISTIRVVNATIARISIQGISNDQLVNFCSIDDTVAVIANLTDPAGRELSTWAKIYIIPNQDVSGFSVTPSVKLPNDIYHPGNNVGSILPYELVYKMTKSGTFYNGL